ncbi:MAG: N utilization substance protein B-like protein [Candidatus Nomurabacteria bacterium GW2011_GWE1_32_28]|uniref:Transcription antitermination protein NusB n=1 Tax=Candidatus Nomurabacteria bacterium GW2011_GWF1_31_48 TaxID=1618767 RepID=A0A0F9YEX6_9BACT|nr:MAG: N utilization substance protein B-like protein [Candidatus Nomurabacteria bacterium GW2011_GWF2_30_133]KKP28623.1 MAG: N utilization substance protein B-like protein [Candidatus Nomurabacteria bacterium GW2011_GWE2_31_40]KKP30199.1 MAG: N utilization substance protein B-like protein [Candidatus Nomurabacteria bacterium GW2011_GWF1_31_48]KKP34725.1 MAG: N utilization substance protein B-like protein [Candidatus Nomurabacteria bacterium GW2011_GWE1_32_28]HBR66047.1 transcription antitermi
MANRHLSRSIVLQTLFEWDFITTSEQDNAWTDDKKKEALNRNLKEFAPGLEDDFFVSTLIKEVFKNCKVIDEIIEKAAPDWPLDKISIVDRNILRIGLTELLFGDRNQVPPKVAINEAIELAKTFGGENSSKFVNGVLGAVYKEIGEPGKEQISKKKENEEPLDVSKLPVEKLGGALIYAKKDGAFFFALVHDVFGYWTLSKGRIEENEETEDGTIREIKEEVGLDITIKEKIGENEYVASHPEKGKILKKVVYFLAESEYTELKLGDSGGLDNARWFQLKELPELRVYNDIIPLITRAIEILTKK